MARQETLAIPGIPKLTRAHFTEGNRVLRLVNRKLLPLIDLSYHEGLDGLLGSVTGEICISPDEYHQLYLRPGNITLTHQWQVRGTDGHEAFGPRLANVRKWNQPPPEFPLEKIGFSLDRSSVLSGATVRATGLYLPMSEGGNRFIAGILPQAESTRSIVEIDSIEAIIGHLAIVTSE